MGGGSAINSLSTPSMSTTSEAPDGTLARGAKSLAAKIAAVLPVPEQA